MLLPLISALAMATQWPSDDGLQLQDLGKIEITRPGLLSGKLDVAVPDGASSTAVYCDNFRDHVNAAMWTITDPKGARPRAAPDKVTFRAGVLDDMLPILLPLDKPPLLTGGWGFQYRIGGKTPGILQCEAVSRIGELGNKPTLGIEFVLVGVTGISAADHEHHQAFKAMRKRFEAELATAGIHTVYRYADYGGNIDKYAVINLHEGKIDELRELFASHTPETQRSLPVFLVREIVDDDNGGATIMGLAYGRPAAAGSGIAITAADLLHSPGTTAKILAHQVGHFLGLHHAVDKGGEGDPLDDTPHCEDADGDGVHTGKECEEAAGNVMWWSMNADVKASFTPGQTEVLRTSPLLQ